MRTNDKGLGAAPSPDGDVANGNTDDRLAKGTQVKRTRDGDDIVTEARKRFQDCESKYATMRDLALEDTRFAWGDSDNRLQWPVQRWEERLAQRKVSLTVNVTAQHCNQIINDVRSQQIRMKFNPVDDQADKRTAKILTAVHRNTTSQLSADLAHKTGFEHAVYGGEGYWLVTTDYESPESFDQVANIVPIMNPSLVYVDANAILPDRSDARYAFVFEDISRDEYEARFGDEDGADPLSWSAADSSAQAGWCTRDTVRVANYYYRCEYEDELWFFPMTGESILASKAKPLGMKRPAKWRKTTTHEWRVALLAGNAEKPLSDDRIAGKHMPVITCIGKEININGDVIRKGVVRDLKDPQRIVNYSYSETVQTVALQNRVPYMAAVEAIAGMEQIWQNANRTDPAYLPYISRTENGEQIDKPTRQEPPQMNAAQVQLLGMSIEQMRAASGQHNANFGIKSEAQSGIGIQRLKAQGEIATLHFQDNYKGALAYEATVCLSIYQEILDTRRIVRLMGEDGKHGSAIADPTLQGSYAEQPKGTALPQRGGLTLATVDGQQVGGQPGMRPEGMPPGVPPPEVELDAKREDEIDQIFNPTVGRFDVVIEQGPSVSTQRQEAFGAMTEIASRNPRLMEVAGDIILGMADFPKPTSCASA